MRIHSFNAGTMEPISPLLTNGRGTLFGHGRIVCHCLLIDGSDGICLVDTGFGTQDIAQRNTLLATGLGRARPRLSMQETVVVQLADRGISPGDVRHIIMTHMDRDHAGGLADFPKAKVHLSGKEYRSAVTGEIAVPPQRYARYQWAHQPNFIAYDDFEVGLLGLAAAPIHIGKDEIYLVALPGHTFGHCGVLIAQNEGWLLHAGDAFYHRRQIAMPPQQAPLLLRLLEWKAQISRTERLNSLLTVRRIATSGEVTVICSHDPDMFDAMARRNAAQEAPIHEKPAASLRRVL